MSQPLIEIVVSPTGQVRVETRGFAGTSCQAASEFIEKALGQRASETRTAEFYQPQSQSASAQEGA